MNNLEQEIVDDMLKNIKDTSNSDERNLLVMTYVHFLAAVEKHACIRDMAPDEVVI